jgi:hypothetical protein
MPETYHRCTVCGRETSNTTRIEFGVRVCAGCLHTNYRLCSECSAYTHIDDPALAYGMCPDCWSRHTGTCVSCEEHYLRADMRSSPTTNELYCSDCYDSCFTTCSNCNAEIPTAPHATLCPRCARLAAVCTSTFDRNPSRRTVGFELEYIQPTERIETSNPYGTYHSDNSVRPLDGEYGTGREFASIVFSGDTVFDAVESVCASLLHDRCYVNYTCGLHIHLGMRNESDTAKRNLQLWWTLLEQIIFLLVPVARRENRYCRAFRYALSQTDRYRSLNLCALHEHGTYEVRLHEGTLNAQRINRWIAFLLHFFDHFTQLDCTPERRASFTDLTRREKLLFLVQQTKLPLSLAKELVRRIRDENTEFIYNRWLHGAMSRDHQPERSDTQCAE